jgi:hypothetical protein
MRHGAIRAALTALLLLLGLTAGRAENRVALVVGNSAYRHVPALADPSQDAKALSAAFKRLGFSVKTVLDANLDQLRRAVLEFGRRARGSDMAVIYFAGHGMEMNGENWLFPVDADLKSDSEADSKTVALRTLWSAALGAKELALVILDAPRDSPFAAKVERVSGSALGHGLAPVEPGDNDLVAYAAMDGTIAVDSPAPPSPYTAALLKHIETPGLEINFLFRNVRDEVIELTHGEQLPTVYGSLSKDEVYFVEAPAEKIKIQDAVPADDIAWSFINFTTDTGTLRRFADEFPSSPHAAEAQSRVAYLEQASLQPGPSDSTPPEGSTQSADAGAGVSLQSSQRISHKINRPTPAVEIAWNAIKTSKDPVVLRRFADQFPAKRRTIEVRERLAALGYAPAQSGSSDLYHDLSVRRCFGIDPGDLARPHCEEAFQRFPANAEILIRLCLSMGKAGACAPSVTPSGVASKKASGPAAAVASKSDPKGGCGARCRLLMKLAVRPATTDKDDAANKSTIDKKSIATRHMHGHTDQKEAAGTRSSRWHKGSIATRTNAHDRSTTPSHLSHVKSSAGSVKSVNVRTPHVRVHVATPTVRVPTVPVRVPVH